MSDLKAAKRSNFTVALNMYRVELHDLWRDMWEIVNQKSHGELSAEEKTMANDLCLQVGIMYEQVEDYLKRRNK